MSLGSFLFVYVLGGLTFLPLALLAFLAFIIYLSPPVGDNDPSKLTKHKLQTESTTADSEKVLSTLPKPLQGWIVVRRTFDEPPQDGASYVGNLMRSFLDSKQSNQTNSTSHPRRPRDTFYAVLKGTVLYLYEDEACSDCYAALQVAAYDVDIYFPGQPKMLDGELFAKRNAIRLRGKDPKSVSGMPIISKDTVATTADGSFPAKEATVPPITDEHFIFVKSTTIMEDWYLALIHASTCSSTSTATSSLDPLPSLEAAFSPDDMAHLVRTLDQQPDPIPMRWLNALVGRVFFSLYRTSGLEANLIARLMKKIAKVPRPAFLTDISVREVNVGNTAPLFSKPMLKELTKEGDASVELGLSYKSQEGEHSGIRITVEATVTINIKDSLPLNLGNRFDLKPRTVKLVLAVILRSLEGNLLVKVKRPPSNRLWYGFTSMPKMELELLPIVSDRKIKWGLVLKPIESLLREVIQESVVLPYMDDIPFFDTDKYPRRGGIFPDAVRTVYDFEAPSSSTVPPATVVMGDDNAQVHTVPASTNIPVSANLEVKQPSDQTVTGDQTTSATSLPADLSAAADERSDETSRTSSSYPDIGMGRSSTTGSLPSNHPSSSARRSSWLPRFVTKNAVQNNVPANTSLDPNEVEPPRTPEVGPVPIEEPTTTSLPVKEETPSQAPETSANPFDPVQSEQIDMSQKPKSGPDVATNLRDSAKLEGSDIDHATGSSMEPLAPVVQASGALDPVQQPLVLDPSELPRKRSPTLTHHPSRSAAANFYSAPRSTPNGSTVEAPVSPPRPSPDDTRLADVTITSAGITPTSPATPVKGPESVPMHVEPSSSGSQTPPTSTSKSASSPRPASATQQIISAWKNRNTDKQLLASTARDVARDAMKKWGFALKKDSLEAPQPGNASPPSTAGKTSRPPTPESKPKTFEQMRLDVAERHERERKAAEQKVATERTGQPSANGHVEDVFGAGPSKPKAESTKSTNSGPPLTGALNAPFLPATAKPTTQLQGPSKGPTPPVTIPNGTPPPLPSRDLTPDVEERIRRLSNTSQQSVHAAPVQRQPGQAAAMRIPGIHASHRGDVMAMGSTPPMGSDEQPNPSNNNGTGTVGPKTAATLQSVYRLFKPQNNPSDSTDTPGIAKSEAGDASPAPATVIASESQPPPPLPPRGGPTEAVPDVSSTTVEITEAVPSGRSSPASHERSVSGSSAASALKQIQASDAARLTSEANRSDAASTRSSRNSVSSDRRSTASATD
ncbi:hypothetical protein FRB99_008634 [Tulasnella sp. 403]|nr:hypothetical protein FRB99_008634 [Tulasnella sp. 403]